MKKQSTTFLQLHIYELQIHLWITFFSFFYLFSISYLFSDQIFFFFFKTLPIKYFIFTNFSDKILTNIYFSLFMSILIMSQILFFQIWFFLKNGFFKHENFFFLKIFFFFFLSNILLIFYTFKKILPFVWSFFTKNTIINIYIFNIYFEPNIKDFFFFFILYIYIYLSFIVIFFFFFILLKKFLTINQVIKLRHFFYLKFLIISIIFCPPDIYSQFFFFFLMFLFFEFLIIYIYIFLKYRFF